MTPAKKAIMAASLAAATSITAYFEGRSLVGYLDPVGIPTICYGHTATAALGQTLSEEECQQLLAADLGWALSAVDRHLPGAPPLTRAALGSFTYNVGVGAFERSTLLRKARAGDWVGACHELDRWVYAGGRKLNGLVRRREAERQLCLEGLNYEPNTGYRAGLPAADQRLSVVADQHEDHPTRPAIRAAGYDDSQGRQSAQYAQSPTAVAF